MNPEKRSRIAFEDGDVAAIDRGAKPRYLYSL
jgi:hypothetical protein